eukprot:316167-Amphidinium_carterae.2
MSGVGIRCLCASHAEQGRHLRLLLRWDEESERGGMAIHRLVRPLKAIAHHAQSYGLKRDWDQDMLAYNQRHWTYTVKKFVTAACFVDVHESAVRICKGSVFASMGTLMSMDAPSAVR